jgi:arylsulfatase A-like enzyme
MTNSQDHRIARIDDRAVTTESPQAPPGAARGASGTYRPSRAFLRALRRSTDRGPDEGADRSGSTPVPSGAPGVWSLVGAALAVGVATGFLELAVAMIQVHWLRWVGLSTLKISRHVAWMVPAVETLTTLGLAMALVGPSLAWSAWREGRRRSSASTPGSPSWTWTWAGMVLGTLLFFGPLLAVRRLHTAAALVLSIGAGFRVHRVLVRPTPGWCRGSCWVGAVALGGLIAFSCWEWDRVVRAEERAWSRPSSRAPNLLWIVMDTVRADHMSLHGYARPTTPELARWAGEGITFTMARSAAPWTLPSHLTMFTGLWPFEHGGRIDRPYHGPSPTLAEHLAAAGYATAGLAGNAGMCNATYGVGRGFDYYVEFLDNHEVSVRQATFNSKLATRVVRLANWIGLPILATSPKGGRRLAPELIGHAREWLGRVEARNEADSRRPFFLFMNFMDVHSPYVPLAGSTRRFWTDELPPRKESVPEAGWRAMQARDVAPPDRRPERQRELDAITRRLVDLYDDCLLGLDAELGRFLDGLRTSGLLEQTWVVVTSDHGEEFGEHSIYGHGASLYNQVTHVPLILIPPMAARGTDGDPYAPLRGRRIDVPVSQRDLPATLTGLLLPVAANPFPGCSLARHWEADTPGLHDPILAQMESQRFAGDEVQMDLSQNLDSVVVDGHLFIESVRSPPELYDLRADPHNRRNLAGRSEHRSRQERLKQELDAIRRLPDSPEPPRTTEGQEVLADGHP